MRDINWDEHRAHRDQVVADKGQWVGLLDEDGVPFLDLPDLIDLDWPETRGAAEDVSVTMRVRTPGGRLHRVVSELVAENLGKVDEVAKLVPVTGPPRLLALERRGLSRRTMLISHVEVEGDVLLPHTMTIHGVDLLVYLDLLPCPSNPVTWTGEFTRFERDWVGPEDVLELFEHPRDLADMKVFTVADGASVEGSTDQVIYRLITESLDAVYRMAGITDNPPYACVLEESDLPPGPVPDPVWHSVTIQHGFGWKPSRISGDKSLIDELSYDAVSFHQDMTCDRNVKEYARYGTTDEYPAGEVIPAGLRVTSTQPAARIDYTFTVTEPEILPTPSGSPYTIIRPTDNSIWAEVGEIALATNINLGASMWWPGDPQPTGLDLVHPTIVFTIKQEG